MGPCFEGGSEWCYNGFMRIPYKGPTLRDHRIYFGSWPRASFWSLTHLNKHINTNMNIDIYIYNVCICIYSHPGVDRIWFLKGFFEKIP